MDKKTMVAIGAVVLAIIAGFVGYSMMPKEGGGGSAPAISPDDPAMKNIAWVKQKAKECGGDMNKLSAEDKAKVISILGQNYAAISIERYSKEK
jgi:hypothetical protein